MSTLNVVRYQCGYKVIAIFSDADTRIIKVQIRDHEMKMWNLTDGTPFFLLRNIKCRNRIQSLLKSHETLSSSEANFSKNLGLMSLLYKNRIDKSGQMIPRNCTLKYLDYILLIPSLVTTTGT